MTSADLVSVVSIEQAANQFPWSEKHFSTSLKSGHHAWVFEQSNHIVGFAIVQQILDEAHLLNICVSPGYQGKGLGREIINHVIEFSQSISAMTILLEVRRSNQRAQNLYLDVGFNEMSVRKGYYPAEQGREDAILMGMDIGLLTLFNVD